LFNKIFSNEDAWDGCGGELSMFRDIPRLKSLVIKFLKQQEQDQKGFIMLDKSDAFN
jgi:hypothetical protein